MTTSVDKSIFYPDKFKREGDTEVESLGPFAEKICTVLEEVSQTPTNPDLKELIRMCNTQNEARWAARSIRTHLQNVLQELNLVNGPEAREVEQKYAFALGAMYIATSQPYDKSVL